MTQFEHPDFSMHQDDFDKSLEAVMQHEERSTRVKHADLSSHPIYGLLLEGPGELNTPPEGSVKMSLFPHYVPDVDIGNRVKAIGEFFNSSLTNEHWQKVADQHPAGPLVRAELQEALDATLMPSSDYWSTDNLHPLMDRLDKLGFQCAFDKSSMVFSIMFSEACEVRLNDVQQDLRNKRLLEKINSGPSFLDAKPTVDVGETATGWVDPVKTYNRTLIWKIELSKPAHKPPLAQRMPAAVMGKEYVYTG